MKILKFALIFLILLIPLISAQQIECDSYIPPVKLNTCATLLQTCSSCDTGVNVTAIYYPFLNGTILYPNEAMTQHQNNYNYSFCDTTTLGTYIYSTEGSPDGIPTTGNVCFEVTPNGDILSLEDVLVYVIVFVISLLVFLFFFHRTLRTENLNYKIPFSILSYFMYVFMIFLVYRLAADYLPTFTYLSDILFYVLLVSIMLIFPFFILAIAFLLKAHFESLREVELRKRGHSDADIANRRR